MTRFECEEKILEKIKEVVELYHQYNPDGCYLAASYSKTENGGVISINNSYWHGGEDSERVITANLEVAL